MPDSLAGTGNTLGDLLMTVTEGSRPSLDKEALKRKYREERDKRLRPDGNAQYQRLTGRFAHYAVDPYTPLVERPPVADHVTFTFIGGGFAGLVTGARLTTWTR